MKTIVTADYDALSREAARQIALVVQQKPSANVVVATGDTPVGAYRELASLRREGKFDPANLRVFQLDEYVGIGASDERTLWGWMERIFVTPLQIPDANLVRLHCDSQDIAATCRQYDAAIEQCGGLDLCILGLGMNGHIGFNEPPAQRDSSTRLLDLSEASLDSNSSYWGGRDRVPLQAMTAGMRQLLGAKRIILLVSGARKRDILVQVMQGPISGLVPASFLQDHPDVIIICDEAASSPLNAVNTLTDASQS